jgi:hypothetical protein
MQGHKIVPLTEMFLLQSPQLTMSDMALIS